ncbi:MAG: GNAT family N-acetyltransferase [Pseudomonadota bacterium]
MTDELKTERLVLRRVRRADADDIAALLGNIAVAKWLTRVPWPYGPSDAEEFITRVEDQRSEHFAITSEARLIGVISSQDHLGYWLGQPFWGYGFATEAGSAVINRFFQGQADQLHSGYLEGNDASCRVLSKLGFAETHLEHSFVPAQGKKVVQHKMVLIREVWEAAA